MKKRRSYDPNAPRFLLTHAASKGGGTVAGFAYTYGFATREAARLAQQSGYVITVIDCLKQRRVYTAQPSPAAVARRKTLQPPRLTSGGQPATSFNDVFIGRPRRQEQSLSDRAEDPTALPLKPSLPADYLFDIDLARPSS